MNKPMEYTLWLHCFYEEAERCKREGCETVQFADVDRVVIEVSKGLTEFQIPEKSHACTT